jgi:hypothetical protein
MSDELWSYEKMWATSLKVAERILSRPVHHDDVREKAEHITVALMQLQDDCQQRIDELRSENARLRALLPSAEVQRAIRRAIVDAGWTHRDGHIQHVYRWLERLEGEVSDIAQYRGILPYDPDGPSSEERIRRLRDGGER